MERTDNLIDKIKSLNDLKKEFKAFFLMKGYSKLLGTSSLFKKLLWLVFMATVFVFCIIFIDKNHQEVLDYGVVTVIKNQENKTLVFPAVTFCAYTITSYSYTTFKLSYFFQSGSFEGKMLSLNDFEQFQMYHADVDTYSNCYKFNGGRNASNHQTRVTGV